MIIDTTCSVIERKMKEVPEEPEFTFKISDCNFTMGTDNITFITSGAGSVIFDGGGSVVFDCEVNFNSGVIFNKCVTFNDCIWRTNPVPKATPDDIADIQAQLAATVNDPNLTINNPHTFCYEPTLGKVASLPDDYRAKSNYDSA